MASILDSVNQRTQLVGQNRLELLLFRLNGRQRFGINVFKVREVLQCPPLTVMPKLNSCIRGVAHIRGQTISVIDLSMAMGKRPIEDLTKCFIIISEYNRSIQGFLVHSVERIINMNWESILPPPKGAGRINYMTAVTEVDGELVEIAWSIRLWDARCWWLMTLPWLASRYSVRSKPSACSAYWPRMGVKRSTCCWRCPKTVPSRIRSPW